jgi:Oxidoreductase family, C-terminal alpha/beta domain
MSVETLSAVAEADDNGHRRRCARTHGGADPLIRRELFVGETEESRRLSMAADSRQGAYAVAVGEALWRSVRDNRPYTIRELLGDID